MKNTNRLFTKLGAQDLPPQVQAVIVRECITGQRVVRLDEFKATVAEAVKCFRANGKKVQ